MALQRPAGEGNEQQDVAKPYGHSQGQHVEPQVAEFQCRNLRVFPERGEQEFQQD